MSWCIPMRFDQSVSFVLCDSTMKEQSQQEKETEELSLPLSLHLPIPPHPPTFLFLLCLKSGQKIHSDKVHISLFPTSIFCVLC